MTRVLLVGGGITSAVTGALLQRSIPNLQLELWDKARGAGGRMSTSRNPYDSKCTVDLGAQYISVTPEYDKLHKTFYDELLEAKVLLPLHATVAGMKEGKEISRHFVTPEGMSSLVKHFIKKSMAKTNFETHVNCIRRELNGWSVTAVNGKNSLFDVVVLTMPVPQIINLLGSVSLFAKDDKVISQLNSVKYSSRYALGLFFEEGSPVKLPGEVSAQYIDSDPIIRYIAIDNLKRGVEQSGASVVIHTSVPFGVSNVEKTPDLVQPILLAHVKEMFPEWPEPKSVKCQKWRYSQVSTAFPGLPGAIELENGLIVGGDAFTHSNVDGCIESAIAISDKVIHFAKNFQGLG